MGLGPQLVGDGENAEFQWKQKGSDWAFRSSENEQQVDASDTESRDEGPVVPIGENGMNTFIGPFNLDPIDQIEKMGGDPDGGGRGDQDDAISHGEEPSRPFQEKGDSIREDKPGRCHSGEHK